MTPSFERSNALQARLHDVVPGGAHTFAKGSDQYPEGMAPVLARGHGARVWDVDGNEFVEYGMGMRAVTLGHGYAPVLDAVRAALLDGVSFTRPTELELAAAEDFLRVVPGADMVKFCKNASDATSAALRLARAATGREVVAMCRDQPYFSSQDWFVGTLPISTGVPEAVRSLVRGFPYDDLAAVAEILAAEPVAAVILEAASALAEPSPGYLAGLKELCERHGTVLIFDETITGFRWAAGGAQAVYGLTPDLSTWGKAMGNGFSIAALAGRRDLMELGGLRTDRPRAFLLSSTNGAEATGLAAFRAVVRAYADTDPVAVMERQGRALADGVNAAAAEAGISGFLSVLGRPSCQIFRTADATGTPSQAMRTLFLQEILRRGVLGQSYVISAAHTDIDVEQTVEAARAATVVYRKALETGRPEELFTGRPVAPAHRLMAEPRRLHPPGPAVPPARAPEQLVRPLPASPR
jgi:glutamate-1-semialdehyde 2,1-aminomutase